MMAKIHDMGGKASSQILPPENDKVFVKEWHKKVLAITLAVGALGKWNIDRSRYFRESLPPDDYQRFSYYEKWLAALVNLLVDSGLLHQSELKEFKGLKTPNREKLVSRQTIREMISQGDPSLSETKASCQPFEVGQLVKTKHPPSNRYMKGGHTRLPAYSSGQQGKIISYHGCHRLPDSHAHFLGQNPEPLYTVSFTAKNLWGPEIEFPNDEVNLDLWHNYLEAY